MLTNAKGIFIMLTNVKTNIYYVNICKHENEKNIHENENENEFA